jgi:hypothetical protein
VILDTNGLSAVAEGESALEPILRKAAQIATPVIVLGEIPVWDFAVAQPETLRAMVD